MLIAGEMLRPLLICVGESTLTAPSVTENWPAQFAAAFPEWDVANLGFNGRQTQDIDYAAIVHPLVNPQRERTVLFIQTGANDLEQSHSVEQMLSDVSGLVSQATADSIPSLVATCVANGFLNEFADGKRLEFNDGVRNAYGRSAVDFAAPWHRFATIADTANADLYSDTAHPTTLGAQAFMRMAAPSILGTPFVVPSLVLSGDRYVATLPPLRGIGAVFQPCE